MKIPIELNGKTYNYDVPTLSAIPNQGGYFPNFTKINGSFTPLFSFLELERRVYSLIGKFNGKNATFSVVAINGSAEDTIYSVNIQVVGARTGIGFIEPYDGIVTRSQVYPGGSIAYNYKNKKWVVRDGGNSFIPQNDKSADIRKNVFSEDIVGGGTYQPDSNNLIKETMYQSVYFSQPESNYFTARLYESEELTSNMNAADINMPQYPDTGDPDDDPTDPTPSPGDDTTDPIPLPPKPTIDVTNTGFVTLYNPSAIDIRNLAHFMWSGEFVDLIKKMFSAPFDCLIGLKLLYAPLTTGSSQTIWLGNVESSVSAPKITDQFTDFDCGSITVNGYFNSFLDYAPYTKITLFLPFIGYKELNVDEVMNATLHLTYRIDAYSGACIAFLQVTKNIGNTPLNSILYEFDGNAAMDIPFTSGDMSRYVAAVLGTAASTAGAVVSMGAGAKLSTSSVPQTSTDPWTKNPMEKKTVTGLTDLGNGSAELIGGKPHIQRGGSLAGANASMALKTPYIIIERPIQQMPADYANFIGIPLNLTRQLSEVSGFTVVSQVFMASSSATDDELNMIDSLLRQGVII